MKFLCVLAVISLGAVCQAKNNGGDLLPMALLARDVAQEVRNGAQLVAFARRTKVNMNDFVDRMMEHAKEFIMKHDLDPKELPDIKKEFEVKDLIGITWHGELDLTRGWLQDLSTIYRSGDVEVEYKEKKMLIKAELGFEDLLFNYDFLAKVMKLSKKGEVIGKTVGIRVGFSAEVDLKEKTIELKDLQIVHIGDIEVHFNGLGTVANFVADALTKVALGHFKEQIIDVVEKEARAAIEDALANVDIGDIIGGRH